MSLKSVYLLAVVLLPSIVAFKVKFENGDEAVYELLEVKDKGSLENLLGGQAFVRFARVVSMPPDSDYVFKEGDVVALKIGLVGSESDMRREQKAHDFIRSNAPKGFIEGVVRAEKSLGESSDLLSDGNLELPSEDEVQEKYLILIMESLGKHMEAMRDQREFSMEELEKIYDQLCKILEEMKKIKISHGDVKPRNILFKTDKVEDGIKLADLGLAVFKDCGIEDCGGEDLYVSPIQVINARPATNDDSDVSGAYSIIDMGTRYLPWGVIVEDMERDPNEQIYNAHNIRMALSKLDFNRDPFSTFPEKIMRLSESLEQKIIATLMRATEHELPEIKDKIGVYRAAIANPKKRQLE